MHLFSKFVPSEETDGKVISFQPPKFPAPFPEAARDFHKLQADSPSAFKMNEIIQERTRVAEKVREEQSLLVEQQALEKLKDIQEDAYKVAYELGLEEGRKEAFAKNEIEIRTGVEKLNGLIDSISQIRTELLKAGEASILKLLYFMASRLALSEIEQKSESILPVLTQVLERNNSGEETTLKVSVEDFGFLSEGSKLLSLKLPDVEKIKLEKDESVRRGGCIVETNNGAIDATLEMRLNRLWEAIEASAPKAKDRFEA